MKKKPRKKQVAGATRMLQIGYKPMQLWMPPGVHKEVQRLASEDDRPMTRWVMSLVYKAIRESSKEPK